MPVHATTRCADVFARLGLPFERRTGDAVHGDAAAYRFDLEIEEDLIEEVARIYGYERIPAQPPRRRRRPCCRAGEHGARCTRCASCSPPRLPGSDQLQLRRAALGSATSPATPTRSACSTRSPASMSVMRSTLLGCLVAMLRYNLNRKASRVRVFEVGRVFLRDAGGAGRTARGRRRAPADARRRRWPTGRRSTSSGARRRARSTSSTSRATSRRCSRRARRASSLPRIRRCIPGARAARRARRRGRRLDRRAASALAAEVRAAAGAGAVRARRRARCTALPCRAYRDAPAVPAGACATSRWSSPHGRPGPGRCSTPSQAGQAARDRAGDRLVRSSTAATGVGSRREKALLSGVVMQDTERTLTDARGQMLPVTTLVALLGERFAATLRTS